MGESTIVLLLLSYALVVCVLSGPAQPILVKQPMKCVERVNSAVRSCKCFRGNLDSSYDMCALNGVIMAYKIRWKNGVYSKWFVPRLNDIVLRRNLYSRRCNFAEKKELTRVWTWFYSHTHKYLLCRFNDYKV